VCELLGLSFNQPVGCSLSFRGFRDRGDGNPHGWGVARFEGPSCQVFKEPVSAPDSPLATFLRDYPPFRSQIFIGHVRHASCGGVNLHNTHPFSRPFRRRDVVLAHNGTVCGAVAAGPLTFHPVGETDSERLFCALLTRLSQESIAFTDHGQIETLLREFNELGTVNLLFSEGEHLFCYHDRGGYTGLYMTRRVAPFSRVSLCDEDWQVDLTEEKRPSQKGYVVATRPLTRGEEWSRISPGSLVVLKDGECVYGGATKSRARPST
jgi:predicted glutamine amidotransferase